MIAERSDGLVSDCAGTDLSQHGTSGSVFAGYHYVRTTRLHVFLLLHVQS